MLLSCASSSWRALARTAACDSLSSMPSLTSGWSSGSTPAASSSSSSESPRSPKDAMTRRVPLRSLRAKRCAAARVVLETSRGVRVAVRVVLQVHHDLSQEVVGLVGILVPQHQLDRLAHVLHVQRKALVPDRTARAALHARSPHLAALHRGDHVGVSWHRLAVKAHVRLGQVVGAQDCDTEVVGSHIPQRRLLGLEKLLLLFRQRHVRYVDVVVERLTVLLVAES
eukprot:scaffold1690_cov247-Pinguiococcus_pyrenoidosus.AAC.6